MRVHLNSDEQELAKYVAKKRFEVSRKKGVETKKFSADTDLDIDLQGAGAELAFCKLFNLYPDLWTRSYADADAILHSGYTVDIKATKYRNGHLLAAPWKKGKEPDLYVLMVGEFPDYNCVGWIPASVLLQEENKKQMGKPVKSPPYAVTQEMLSPADLLHDLALHVQ